MRFTIRDLLLLTAIVGLVKEASLLKGRRDVLTKMVHGHERQAAELSKAIGGK
jgi:hypothetical protein